jgi:flagellar biosynthetic protein FlhB
MAQDQDDGQKTEDPSQRRLQRARDEGQVAQSREINTWFILAASGIVLLFVAPSAMERIASALAVFVDPNQFLARDEVMWAAVDAALVSIARALVLPFGILLFAAVAGSVAQTGLVFATERIGFDLSHLSPVEGLTRIFSPRGLVEFVKSVIKLGVVSAVVATILGSEFGRIAHLSGLSPANAMNEISRLVLKLLAGVLAVLTALAGGDYVFQRLQYLRSLRMSRRDLKDEQKQAEGDPLVRARLRQIRTDRARKRMMAAVPGASVVITNPTHYAVALAYELGEAGAPKVVAKGMDLIALKIREIAEENGIPIVENPPLARALHGGVELDREIPPEHYKAVAEIIGYVFRLKGKIRPRAAAM